MKKDTGPIFVGETPLQHKTSEVSGEFLELFGETYYKIQNYDRMPPFFMSLVSSSNHWFFISSTGGLTAGRVNPENALFPYYTEDKITENYENTGSKTILLITRGNRVFYWEPFSIRQQGLYDVHRNLYKNKTGTSLVFEEENRDLGLIFRYAWRTGDRFGFIKTSWLVNSSEECRVEFLDGIQNIQPAFSQVSVQNTTSCLLDAYKRSALDVKTGLGIFTLNATLTDLPEPSESLLATTVFQVGLENPNILLSSAQLSDFRNGRGITQETEIRGKRGAYFVHSEQELLAGEEISWHIVADVSQDWSQMADRRNLLVEQQGSLSMEIEKDINRNQNEITALVAQADGLQLSADQPTTAHHFANVLFNIMRGGIFYDQYWISKKKFMDYVYGHNQGLLKEAKAFFSALPEQIYIYDLYSRAEQYGDADLIRLSYTYLPLFFSRRHGDPSRPWNMFSINIKESDGSDRLDYQGNWRDIFQNWEALAWSYPEFVEGMIFTFLNATTADGYNPYRITLEGIDWEIPEPGNPWSNIGYWSDHQIIYLLKLMALSVRVHPGKLQSMLDEPIFSYANVPYRIKPYQDLLDDPYHTILFDAALEEKIESDVKKYGSDGRLLRDSDGQVIHRTLVEKLLTLLLAKLVNFVPEGGIWMNTQRPEWNDANNALVGKGLSVVTLGYLYRFITFFKALIKEKAETQYQVSAEVEQQFSTISAILIEFEQHLKGIFNDQIRSQILGALSEAGSEYRESLYRRGFTGEFSELPAQGLIDFLDRVGRFLAHSLKANRREDDLYHAYNVIQFGDQSIGIKHLDVMLEGQVSILSSGMLSGEDALNLLESLQKSPLYLEDQNSYILYPDKSLPGILEKNSIAPELLRELALPDMLAAEKDQSILVKDELGYFHFSGSIHNERDVRRALEKLGQNPKYRDTVEQEQEKIVDLFESVFRHSEFTGRSSTFFAYEGLGSIYWHMVSKLLLAVVETIQTCEDNALASRLLEKYRDIRAGLGFNKPPEKFGAFPSDPYSHTPKGQGARQPGMTGLVKEEVIARLAELALTVEEGCLVFDPSLLNPEELLSSAATFDFIDIKGEHQSLSVPAGSVAFTYCQTPVILMVGKAAEIVVETSDGQRMTVEGSRLDQGTSAHIFKRDGVVEKIRVRVEK